MKLLFEVIILFPKHKRIVNAVISQIGYISSRIKKRGKLSQSFHEMKSHIEIWINEIISNESECCLAFLPAHPWSDIFSWFSNLNSYWLLYPTTQTWCPGYKSATGSRKCHLIVGMPVLDENRSKLS